MITADKVRNQIQTLIDTANEKTGNNDTDLTSAVGSLVEGYGGEKSYYDTFWDSYQLNGDRETYSYSFSGDAWNTETFKPKYDLRPLYATGIFHSNKIVDLYEHLELLGISVDFSNCRNFQSAFNSAYTERIGVVDTRGCVGSLNSTFSSCKVKWIEKLILHDKISNYSGCFTSCVDLESIIIEGVIAATISFAWSPLLNAQSVQNIIDCLKDLTGQTAQTLTVHKDVEARMSDEQKAQITSKNWILAVA